MSDQVGSYSLAKDRSRREKKFKGGRQEALAQLRAAKQSGVKHKYKVKDVDDVYEEVGEAEYSNIVEERQEDDWIVDDDGSGYVEDGRDIFDEDTEDTTKPSKSKAANKANKNHNIRPHNSKAKSVKEMFAAAPIRPKKPEKSASIQDDGILSDLMAEIQDKKPKMSQSTAKSSPVAAAKKPLKPHNPFSTTTKKSEVTSQKESTKPKVTSASVVRSSPAVKSKLTNQHNGSERSGSGRPSLGRALEELNSADDIDMGTDVEDYCEPLDQIEETTETATEKENKSSAVDIGDINFDDDFGDEMSTPAPVKLEETNSSAPSQPVDIPSEWDAGDDTSGTVPAMDVVVDAAQLPLTTNDQGEQVVRMYWIDAYEEPYKQPGVVYLFGKVWIEEAKAYVSCCVVVRNIERRIFILPRKYKRLSNTKQDSDEPVDFVDVYKEFESKISTAHGITKFKSKKSTMSYAFEIDGIPAESDYLEVRYDASLPALRSDLQGETFSHIFGVNTSSLETFLLERKLKGPSWIDIKKPQLSKPQVSWCKIECCVSRSDCISVSSKQPNCPPLTVMALNLRTLPNPKTNHNEIVGASLLVQHEFYMDKPAPKRLFQEHMCVLSKPSDSVMPFDFDDFIQKKSKEMKVVKETSERALLNRFLAKVYKVDPDLIVGHDVLAFDLEVLLHRMNHNKIASSQWSKIGRLKRSIMPKLNITHKPGSSSAAFSGGNSGAVSVLSGRLLCDVMISAKELIRCRSYDLTELVSHVLKATRVTKDCDELRACYNSSRELIQLAELTLVDCRYILSLMYDLNAIPLALQITNICGNVLNRTLMGGRSQRNEFLLLHAFTEKNFIVPDKTYRKKAPVVEEDMDDEGTAVATKSRRRKPAYAGGLVLEPKKGFYDRFILLLDFNSLYPSIIQEFNICFTTVARPSMSTEVEEGNEEDMFASLQLPDSNVSAGILPTEIRKLVQSRRQVKALMKAPDLSPETYMQYDIRQKALKLTANSMYGCLGFSFSRFYAKPLAALVTSKGREILMKTKELTENLGLEVIYGDTDSIMVNTNSTDFDEVYKIGNKIKAEVNKLHKLVEIEIDGVFKAMLLLKKKKYAALTAQKVGDNIVTSQELKGLDIVRRDWCELAKNAGNFVVSEILSGESRETILENIHNKLTEVSEKVNNGEVDVSFYQISKQLTKNPENYPDKKSLPHVQVALRLNSKPGGKKLRAGDTVYYVICNDGSNLSATQRAYHPDELAKAPSLTIDTKYYLSHQIHPVVSRLCDPIDGTDAAQIAQCLGLDPSGYRSQSHYGGEADEDEALLGAQLSDQEKYKDCERFTYPCKACGHDNVVEGVFTGASSELKCTLSSCSNTKCQAQPTANLPYLCNRLTAAMRKHINVYYQGWLVCEDAACGTKTSKLPTRLHRGQVGCFTCHRANMHLQYTDSMLYTQLCFYRHIFDVKRARQLLTDHKEKDAVKSIPGELLSAYNTLESHVSDMISSSAYSHVNLARLFEPMFISTSSKPTL